MAYLTRFLPVVAVLVAACSADRQGDDAASSDSAENDLTSSDLGASCGATSFGPVFSRDGRYALVDRCDAAGNGKIVRLTLANKSEAVVATFGPTERLANVNDYAGAAFWAFIAPKAGGAPPANLYTAIVADWELTRIVTKAADQGSLYVSPNGKWFTSHADDKLLGDFTYGPLSGNAPPTPIAHGIPSPWVTYRLNDDAVLFYSFGPDGSMRRLDLATGALGPLVTKPPRDFYGADSFTFDGERAFYPSQKDLKVIDMKSGVASTLASAGYFLSSRSVHAPRGGVDVLYFASDAAGGEVSARTVRADGTEPAKTYPGVTETFNDVGSPGFDVAMAGDAIAILGARSYLLDPRAGMSFALPAGSELVGKNFWSRSTQTLVDGTTHATIYQAPAAEPESYKLSRQVAGDGETVWEFRKFECPVDTDVNVITHKGGVDTKHGCQSLSVGYRILRVGTTSNVAVGDPRSSIKILSP